MQDRNVHVLEFWDRKNKLVMSNKQYADYAKNLFMFLLENDISKWDLTTNSLIKKNKLVSCEIVAKQGGIFAGSEEFKFLNKGLKIISIKKDGSGIKNNDVLVKFHGPVKYILERERTMLNLLQRMSGIATATRNLIESAGSKINIAGTRKTLWGLLDKKAVRIGNGLTHRLDLNDGILIKDNHLKTLNHDIKKALGSAINKSKFIEIEVENRKDAIIAAEKISKTKSNSIFAIMLDKINPYEIKKIVKELKEKNLYDKVLLEASGNINESNIKNYINCSVDVISMGCITNSVKSFDMSLEIIK